jgi:rhamnogalacturonan endolyase
MSKHAMRAVIFICLLGTAAAQRKLPPNTGIPPNYDYYTLNPEYNGPPATLGWAEKRIEEKLGRALVAVSTGEGKVYLSWRLLKSDPEKIAFNIYRSSEGASPVKLNKKPIRKTADFIDAHPPLDRENAWFVRSVLDGREGEASGRAVLQAVPPVQPYLSIPLKTDLPPGSAGKVGVGDLDGDGEYDFVVKRPNSMVDPGRIRKSPDTFKIEAYKNDGTFLWRKDLGWSIELGVWYSPMVVWDLNGDGRAEVALKTGEGDPRDANGQVLSGPEYCSVLNGETGEEIARTDWIPRGKSADWGDEKANRMNRNMLGVAFLDGRTPALLVLRGQYGLMRMDAWLLSGKELKKAWSWSNQTSGWRYQGQGSHTIHAADVDGDGCDEILNGSLVVDQDGRILYSNGMGHADRFYVTDVDPKRPGLESVYCFEDPHPKNGLSLWDVSTGEFIAGTGEETRDNQVGECLVGDIDPDVPGMEWWGDKFFFSAAGEPLKGGVPPQEGLVWWDGDLLRELQFRGQVAKWRGPVLNKSIEGRVLLWADILGDWREEIVTFKDNALRVYTTTLPALDRRACLMQDPVYRFDVAFKAMGYDQPPMTGFYLGANP